MHFMYIAFVLTCAIFKCSDVRSQDVRSKEEQEELEDYLEYDSHTFVALIDIVFVDGSKRSCTGSIIHDNVVITAAHCFVHEYDETIKPELTASFVVIGSKKLFDTGYEQYLPIERILTHPQFHGWSADLSLVYTFAGMTLDKPGKIIRLAGDKIINPVDANVTVFSWGHGNDDEVPVKTPKPLCPDSTSIEDETPVKETKAHGVTVGIGSSDRKHYRQLVHMLNPEEKSDLRQPQQRIQSMVTRGKMRRDPLYQYPLLQQKMRNKESGEITKRSVKITTTRVKQLSRYLSSEEDDIPRPGYRQHNFQPRANSTFRPYNSHNMGEEIDVRLRGHNIVTRLNSDPIVKIKTLYKNWRRTMGSQQNKLTVEIFGFVNLASCKKIVEGAMPPRYEIKNGEVACYSSEGHYLTDEDSGAPAVRHGQLVAVTVGGAQCDGDQVGVGMKMSCYCNWIADNLPGPAEMNCCKNCCDSNSKHSDDVQSKVIRQKNKYLF